MASADPSSSSPAPPVRAAPPSIDGVVCDCDGLLLRSAGVWAQAYRTTAERHGLAVPDLKQRPDLVGASVNAACRALLSGRSDGNFDRVRRDFRNHLQAHYVDEARATEGALEFLRHVRALGLPTAVATNGPEQLVVRALDAAGLAPLIDVVVGPESVPRPKPAPDVFLKACARLKVDSTHVVALEDSSIGCAAARAAGMYVVLVPSTTLPRGDFDLVAPSLADAALRELVQAGLTHSRDGLVETRDAE